MSLIQVNNLTFAYEGSYDNIFENTSFQIDTEWKLGFVGRNGRGKTTFLHLLMGRYEYQGDIHKSVDFDYFPFQVEETENLTMYVLEQVFPECELWKVKRELNLMGMEEEILYQPYQTLSNGEQTRVMLALLFSKEHNFLLIDEPTNHLDAEGRKLVSGYLKKKKGFILVSHDRRFLDECVDHILSINKENIEVQKGNFTSWNDNKERMEQYETAENERLQKEVKKLGTAMKRTGNWSDQVEKTKIGNHAADRGAIGHKAAKMMKRSKAIEERRNRALDEKKGLLKNVETAEELKIMPLTYRADPLVEAKEIELYYDENAINLPFDLQINHGERVALQGKNGCGKSTFLKCLTQGFNQFHGELRIGNGIVVSWVPQSTEFLSGSLDAFIEESGIEEWLFKAVLRKLDFAREQFDKEMQNYSEGQKKKVLLARSLCTPAHLYVWDEPLNYIDILSRMQIQKLIQESGLTMLFVEHDAAFVEETATRICRIRGRNSV